MNSKKLFLAYMGAESKERLIEDHEILLVVAENEEEAKTKLKKTKLGNDVHVDAIFEVNNIDGYDIILQKGGEESVNKVCSYTKSSEF